MKTSRFSYHGDDPGEGGVRSLRSRLDRPPVSSNGIPGPEEPLLDIVELVRTVGMRYTHRFALPPAAVPEIDAVAPVVGQITLTNTDAVLLLSGQVSTTLHMECTRCLAPTRQEVTTELDEQFPLVAQRSASHHQEEVQAIDENAEAPVIQGNVLHLDELLRQSLLLAAPALPTCADDCSQNLRWSSATPAPEAPSDSPLKQLGALWAAREQTD